MNPSGLLLLFRESSFHVSVSLWGNRRLTLGPTLARCFTSIHVGVKTRRLSVSFVHFFVDLPLEPLRARFFDGDSLTSRPLLV